MGSKINENATSLGPVKLTQPSGLFFLLNSKRNVKPGFGVHVAHSLFDLETHVCTRIGGTPQ